MRIIYKFLKRNYYIVDVTSRKTFKFTQKLIYFAFCIKNEILYFIKITINFFYKNDNKFISIFFIKNK